MQRSARPKRGGERRRPLVAVVLALLAATALLHLSVSASAGNATLDAPPLTVVRDAPAFGFTVALCAVVKDAEAYFEEWLDYHVGAMGFDAVYLYDNSDAFDLRRWYNNSRGDPVYGRVEVTHFPGQGNGEQVKIYADCVRNFGRGGPRHDYLAFIDVDEFLVPQGSHYSAGSGIHGVLAEYLVPYGGALIVHWIFFGDANKTAYAPLPVTKRFQWRDAAPRVTVKSIVRSADYRRHRDPHSVHLLNGAQVHTTKTPGFVYQPKKLDRPSGGLLLYHYRYGSAKEYIAHRCNGGNIGGTNWCNEEGTALLPDVPKHILPRPGVVYDDMAWKLLTRHVPKYRLFDSYGWKDYM